MSRTCIVVVTYNSVDVIGRCLASCLRAAPAEVVVVDNASSDGTLDRARRFSEVRCIANETNRGFAGAANQGVRVTGAPLVLLLNPDAELLSPLEDLERACAQPGVGAAAGLLLGEDGRPQRGFAVRRLPTPAALALECLGLNRLWPGNPANRRYRCLDMDLTREQDVEQPPGAFLMFRREVWEKLGGLDEGYYPVWFEDVDFCRRLAGSGYRIRFVPSVRARHRGGHSFAGVYPERRMVWWYRSLLKYASGFPGAGTRGVICVSAVAGATLRAVAGMFTAVGVGASIRGYGRVWCLAAACLFSGRGGMDMPAAAADPAGPNSELNTVKEMRN